MNDKKNLKNNFIFNWVLKNKLAIGTSPSNKEDIIFLKNNKVKNILGLCSETETKWHEDLETSFCCDRVILPDSNQPKLISEKQILNAYIVLNNFIKKGITFIHCYASIERSPLLCIMYIMHEYNLDLEEALDYVKQVHNFTNPRNNQLFLLKKINKENI